MLILTNRELLSDHTDETALTTRYMPAVDRLGMVSVRRTGKGKWRVDEMRPDASDDEVKEHLRPLFGGPRPVLFYLHGNNNTPAACFARCALFESLFGLEVVGFSWPSEGFLPDGSPPVGLDPEAPGDENSLSTVRPETRLSGPVQEKIQRYHQAKTNAKNGIDAMARALRLLGLARLDANGQRFSVAAHSLGVHYLQNTLAVPGATESVGTTHNVALLAACVRAAGHKTWVERLRPQGQIFATFNQEDLVLAGARIADNDEIKLGAVPGPDLVTAGHMRYIDFTGARNDLAQHAYFVRKGMSAKTKSVLRRIFGSEPDIQEGELPRKVYPVGCDERRVTCFMAAPTVPEGG